MELFRIQNLSFTYPHRTLPALQELTLSLQEGEFVTLCGASGSGKSTLLRQLKPVLRPNGALSGTILFRGRPLEELSLRRQCQEIGFVRQSPDNQLVTDQVWHELAFGLESLGLDTPTIRRRVAEIAGFFGMEEWFSRPVAALSGGQKQLLNLASTLVLQPSVLLLDEPTAQLDPIAAEAFLSTLQRVNRELGTTILLSAHRWEELFPLSDRVLVLEKGRLAADDTPRRVSEQLLRAASPLCPALPTAAQLWAGAPSGACPLTVREGQDWLRHFAQVNPLLPLPPAPTLPEGREELLRASEISFRYEQAQEDVIRGLSLTLRRGECYALLGGNGSGKTTLLSLLAGVRTPQRGRVTRQGRCCLLPQNPQALFLKATVEEDLRFALPASEQRLREVVKLCGLRELLDRHPYDLSGGEQQRLALAKLLLQEPELLLLDEPTKGLDAVYQERLRQLLRTLCAEGITVLLVSHDLDFCASCAHRCGLLFEGAVVTEAPPRAFFAGNRFYTTTAQRIARPVAPEAVTLRDLTALCGLSPPPAVPAPCESETREAQSVSAPQGTAAPAPAAASRRWYLLFSLLPLTLWGGIRGDWPYYLTALLILLETMLPFFLRFERRKPPAREMVTLAALCAVVVASRAAFFFLPQCKPVMALVILVGVAFGGETGFLVGAMSMLCSNLFFAQGAWTPWQMCAMGTVGLLAGVLFRTGRLPRCRAALSSFGAGSAILIYGGIMNPASALLVLPSLSWETLLAYYAAGLPLDCVQAAATAVFLWFGSAPVLEKLERLQTKYQLKANP